MSRQSQLAIHFLPIRLTQLLDLGHVFLDLFEQKTA